MIIINSKREFNNPLSRSPRSTPQVAKKEEKASSEKDENEDSDSRPNNANNSMEEFSEINRFPEADKDGPNLISSFASYDVENSQNVSPERMPEDNYMIQNSSSNHREALSLSARMTRNAELPRMTKTKERLSLKFMTTSPLLKPDDRKPLTVQKRKSENHFHDNYVSNTSRQM